MEASPECPVCLNLFSSRYKPKSLPCGHSFCCFCTDSFMQKVNQLCPICNTPIQVASIPINYSFLERILFYEILCAAHPEVVATHFSLDTVTAYCLECATNSSGLNLIEASFLEIGNLLLRKGFEIEYTLGPQLTQELKEQLKKLAGCTNMLRIKILKEIINKTQQPECEIHFSPGTLIDINTGKILCEQCQKIGNELPLSDPQVECILSNHILRLAECLNSVFIPFHYKENLRKMRSLSIIEKIAILRHIITKKNTQRNPVIPATCNNCNQEFSFPSNLPLKLPCLGGHYICEICAKLIKNCPIDSSPLNPTQLNKTKPNMPSCHICNEPFSSNLLPELQPCGIVRCGNCNISPCDFCNHSHNSTDKQVSRYFMQLEEFLMIKCVNDAKPAWVFSKSDLKAYCSACGKNKPGECLSNFDLSTYLINECHSKALQFSNQLTPVLRNSLQSISMSTNSARLELLKILLNISAPVPVLTGKVGTGQQIPPLSCRGHFMQRFNSVLPNYLLPQIKNVRPWYIKTGENQVEVFAFQVSKSIRLIGISVTCPVDDKPGIVEYVDLFEGQISVGRLLSDRRVRGCVEDLIFDSEVVVKENMKYQLVFKFNVEFVYKGNPLDRTDCVGTDGTHFDIMEGYLKGLVVNGQSHISGPLVRVIYKDNRF